MCGHRGRTRPQPLPGTGTRRALRDRGLLPNPPGLGAAARPCSPRGHLPAAMSPPAAARPLSVPGPAPLTSPAGSGGRKTPHQGGAEPEGWGHRRPHGPAAPNGPSAGLRSPPPGCRDGRRLRALLAAPCAHPRALVQPLPPGVRGGARPSHRPPPCRPRPGPAAGGGSRRRGGGRRRLVAAGQPRFPWAAGHPLPGCSGEGRGDFQRENKRNTQ